MQLNGSRSAVGRTHQSLANGGVLL